MTSLVSLGLSIVPRLQLALADKYQQSWVEKGLGHPPPMLRFHPLMGCIEAANKYPTDSIFLQNDLDLFGILAKEEWMDLCGLNFSFEENANHLLKKPEIKHFQEALEYLKIAGPLFLEEFESSVTMVRFFIDSESQWQSLCKLQHSSALENSLTPKSLPKKIGSAGSFSKAPSFVVISASLLNEPLNLAIQLTHEATHQLVFALESNADYLSSSSEDLIFSPARKELRPVRAALHGAFAVLKEIQFLEALCSSLGKLVGPNLTKIEKILTMVEFRKKAFIRGFTELRNVKGLGISILSESAARMLDGGK